MAASTEVRPLPPALPADINDWTRHLKKKRTLPDLVEDVHRALVEDDRYRALLRAGWNNQAVEGSISADDIMAALMIREKAKTMEGSEVAQANLATIRYALCIVRNRYHASRRHQRAAVNGAATNGGGA